MRLIYSAFGLALLATLFLNNASGPAEVQSTDRTGSPLSPGTCGVVGCHSANAFGPSLSVRLLDANSQPVTVYTPGASYQLEVVVNTQTNAQRFGFQAVALTGANNTNAGTLAAATGIQVIPLSGRRYAEHSMKSVSNTFRTPWTAPAAGTGEVRFYAAGLAANNNGTTSGDGVASLTTPLTVTELTSSTNDTQIPGVSLAVFPNPVHDWLQVRVDGLNSFMADVMLYDMQGRVVQQEKRLILPGRTDWSMEMAALPSGQYWLELRDGRFARTGVAIKK